MIRFPECIVACPEVMLLKRKIANIEKNAIRLLTAGYCDRHMEEIRKMSFEEFVKQQECPLCIKLKRTERTVKRGTTRQGRKNNDLI